MTRVLPGTIVAFAAMTIPELSVGAGDLGEGRPSDDLPEPKRAPPPRQAASSALADQPAALAGVRYASLLRYEPSRVGGAGQVAASAAALPSSNLAPIAAVLPEPLSLSPPTSVANTATTATAPSMPQVAAPAAAFATALPVRAAMGDADIAVLDAPALALVSVPIRPVAVATIPAPDDAGVAVGVGEPSSSARDLAMVDIADPETALAPAADRPALTTALGRATGSFTALLPPEEQAALQRPSMAMPSVSAAGLGAVAVPAITSAGDEAAPAPVLPAPVSLPAPEPAQSLTPAPKAVSAAKSAPPAAERVAPVSAPAATTSLAPLPQAKPPVPGLGAKGDFALDIKAQLLTRVDGKTAGIVDFQQTATGLAVRLGSIVELLGDHYNPTQIARIRGSSASNLYLSLAELQAQGIPISYDPVYDEFNVGQTDTRPKAARKVHMDQISVPERGAGSTGMSQIRR